MLKITLVALAAALSLTAFSMGPVRLSKAHGKASVAKSSCCKGGTCCTTGNCCAR